MPFWTVLSDPSPRPASRGGGAGGAAYDGGECQQGQHHHCSAVLVGRLDEPATLDHQDAAEDRGHAHAEVGDDVEDGEHAGPLVGQRVRHHRADAALEAAAEPDAGDGGAEEEHGRGGLLHAEQGDRDPGDQGGDAERHHACGSPAEQVDRRAATPASTNRPSPPRASDDEPET